MAQAIAQLIVEQQQRAGTRLAVAAWLVAAVFYFLQYSLRSAPDLEAGNILAKQLSFLANADSAGMVLGARVPVILTSRADSVRSRIASCAVAKLVAHARRAKP